MTSGSASPIPTVTTDKPAYFPEEIVRVSGTGLAPNTAYDVAVTRGDGTIVHGDGSFIPGWDTVTTDDLGNFLYSYQLDGVNGLYTIDVYDSPWDGPGSAAAPLAETTFTDDQPLPTALTATYNANTGVLTTSGTYTFAPCPDSHSAVGFAIFINGATPVTPGSGALDGSGAVNTMHPANMSSYAFPCSASGSWGPSTYTLSTTPSQVCVVMYHVKSDKLPPSTGDHSTVGAGSNRSTDNSYEKGNPTNAYKSPACTAPTTTKTFTVNKNFSDNSLASVTVAVSCTSGTPSASGTVSHASPRTFTITGFAAGATCTATETVPSGYTANQAGCAGVAIANSGTASCTITNTLNSATLTVNKNFSDNSAASVTVSVTCTNGGSASPASGTVTHAAPRTFTITSFSSGATCTATETLPNGYTNSTGCSNVAIANGGTPSCTITNTLKSGTFIVNKNFSDNSAASVTVAVTCTSGTPSPASGTVSHASPKTFTITGFNSGATCAATETVPAGYTANQTTCAAGVVIVNGGSVSCTITNTNSATFTVNKNFNDNSSASVTVSVTCSSGTVSPGSGSVSHAAPRIYAITGFSTGATCTATEAIPAGYIETDNCAGVAISNGGTASCTINNRSGSITVCKVIIDAAGNVVDGSAVAGQTLSDAFFQPSPVPSTGAADSVPPTTTWQQQGGASCSDLSCST